MMERYNDMLRISAARIFFIVPSLYRFDRCSFSAENSKNRFNAFSPGSLVTQVVDKL